jgi:hypothetical protein
MFKQSNAQTKDLPIVTRYAIAIGEAALENALAAQFCFRPYVPEQVDMPDIQLVGTNW